MSGASSLNGGGGGGAMEKGIKVGGIGGSEDTVVLAGLRKVYAPTSSGAAPNVAVRNVYMGVPQGQVFGYLGVNGAGKTTTLACLTGERYKRGGEAYIHGVSIEEQIKCRRFIGYCSHYDALFDLLTGKEHLRFYGMLKGLRGRELKEQVRLLLRVLSLTKYRNRKAGTYSSWMSRARQVPHVEFIRETMQGRCVVLTTHSMEECEALCHRLGIMVKGQLRCLRTPQHLKSTSTSRTSRSCAWPSDTTATAPPPCTTRPTRRVQTSAADTPCYTGAP